MAISKLKCWYLPSLPDRARGAIDDAAMYHQRVVDVDEEGNLLVSRCVLDHHAQQLFRHLRVRLKLRTLPNARVINSLVHSTNHMLINTECHTINDTDLLLEAILGFSLEKQNLQLSNLMVLD